jgi:hypothetical protein
MMTPIAIDPSPSPSPAPVLSLQEIASKVFYSGVGGHLALKHWMQANDRDIAAILAQIRVSLENSKVGTNEKETVIALIQDLLIQEFLEAHPTQQMRTQSYKDVFANFKVRKQVRENLDKMSIEALLGYVFKERIEVLSRLLRQQAQEKQYRNEQIEAIGELKTLLVACQPAPGEIAKSIVLAQSDEEIFKFRMIAKQADFDLNRYLEKNISGEISEKQQKFSIPYEIFQQLNTALTAHTDKNTNLMTSQQLQIVELNKQITQTWEFLSNFSKRLHDTVHAIISNMR